MRIVLSCLFILLTAFAGFSQEHPGLLSLDSSSHPQTPNSKRVLIVAGSHVILWSASYIALQQAWYKDFRRTSFHMFNDNGEWNQMDKVGHVWTTYQMSRVANEAWKWAGLNTSQSALLGAASGLFYQVMIEIHDGFSAEWGFSWGDMTSDLIGAGTYVLQQVKLHEQPIQIKFSYWPKSYPVTLKKRSNDLYGTSKKGRILKDYNGQTYWISANLRSLFHSEKLPPWLNISIGYGADGLLGGRENKWMDDNDMVVDHSEIPRSRSFYLSPDIDLTKIRTGSRFLKSVLFVVNCIKIPAPALEYKTGKGFSFRALHF